MNRSVFGDYSYVYETGREFIEALTSLLKGYDGVQPPIRLVFFGSPGSNREYGEHLNAIRDAVADRWKERAPVVSYVAQPPLCGATMAMEVQSAGDGDSKVGDGDSKVGDGDSSVGDGDSSAGDGDSKVEYKTYASTPYIVLSGDWGRRVITGGIQGGDLDSDMLSQSEMVFETIRGILDAEGLKPENIVRQWNYLERITDFDGELQRYQAFNDSRSDFYAAGDWSGGYPAATGIGTQWGGVMVEFDALEITAGIEITGIDNPLQIAAHDYSKRVLLGQGERSTPKFERAKALWSDDRGLVYISGTAAIRGEQSLVGSSIEEQTQATLENIDMLTSAANLKYYGVELNGVGEYKCLRVYLKEPGFAGAAKEVIDRTHGHVPAVYVWSDICRCELLIEIEGILTINY